MPTERIVVGISGASGAIYGLRTLERLRAATVPFEVHLVVTPAAERTIATELDVPVSVLRDLADVNHSSRDVGASIASGSYATKGIIVAPCSINTMSSLASGVTGNLLLRAADVALKERRRVVLMIRETHFHLGHLRAMTALTEMGAIVAPPIPAFYHRPQTIDDIVDHSVDRALALFGISLPDHREWRGGNGTTPALALS